jgi:hypothetical protein
MRGGDKDSAGQDYGEGGEGQQAQPVQYLQTNFKFNILFQFLPYFIYYKIYSSRTTVRFEKLF